jgi:hypothetical protein
MNKKEDFTKFKLQIFKYTLATAAIFGLGSLPLLGVNVPYLYGLALGTCAGVFGFNILIFISKKVISRRKAWLAPLGYFIRMPIYILAFFLCYAGYGFTSGIGCILGIMTVQVAIIYVHGIKAKLTKGKQVNNYGNKEE